MRTKREVEDIDLIVIDRKFGKMSKLQAAVIDRRYSENTCRERCGYLVLMALYKFASKSSKGLVPATHDQFLASVRSPEPV